MEVKEGDYILIYLDERRKFLTRVVSGKQFHTHKGSIDLESIIGEHYGSRAKTHIGKEFVVLRPKISDFIMKIRRKTQIIYPQDIGMVIMFAGIGPGDRVVEGGTGVGAGTIALAYHVRPSGRVYSYDVREDLIEQARENLQKMNLIEYVELRNEDITEGIDEEEVDAVVLDIPTPWLVVPHARRALKDSEYFVSFSPTMDQAVNTTEALRENGFVDVRTFESMLRPIRAVRGRARPEMLMVGHTAYITLSRKSRG
ncbi:MAG: tRNA (adenine-N1)-methyltransferase [Candidatus Bathyarchaeia archaeon]